MKVSMLLNPWIVSGGVSVVLGIGLLAVIWRCAGAVGKWLEDVREKLLTRTAFFWAVNMTFMAVSVLHAGVFFGITGSAHSVDGTAGYLGFAVSFFLDLVTIILMQAMLEARYRADDGRARQFLFFIAVCCVTSTFANLAISLNDFNSAIVLPHAPGWVQVASPYVLSSFPLFVIMMSIASEMILNIRPMDKLDETSFEADEKKRVRMLEVRNQYLAKQVQAELEMQIIRAKQRANKAMRKGQIVGSFRWFWEKPLDVDFVVAGVAKQLEAMYETKFVKLSDQSEQLILQVKRLELVANAGVANGTKVVKAPVVKSSHTAVSRSGKVIDAGTEKAVEVELLNGENVVLDNSSTADVSQGRITDALSEGDDDGNLSSINGIAVSVDLASLSLASDVREVVNHYPEVYTEWLSQAVKSVTIPEIVAVTGQSKRRVQYQVGKALKTTSRNENKILVSSVIEWLQSLPLPEQVMVQVISEDDHESALSSDQDGVNVLVDTDETVAVDGGDLSSDNGETVVVNSENVLPDNGETVGDNYLHLLKNVSDEETDKLSITLAAIRKNTAITDEELAVLLGLKRPASVRFWRLKAGLVLEGERTAEFANA